MLAIHDIEKLAELSRIELAPHEKESLRADLDSIVQYVAEIQKVVTSDTVVSEPYLFNVMREDEITTETGAYTELLLQSAPSRQGNYVKVKKILE